MIRIPLTIIVLLLCATTLCAQEVTVKLNFRKTWVETPMGKPVIDRGSEGSWDFTAVDNPYVFVEDNRYYCFFEAQDTKESNWHERIGLAISEDGVHWKKQANNPIVDVGVSGSWDGAVAKLPASVIKHESRYYLFYSGRDVHDTKMTSKNIGVVIATELSGQWIKSARNPLLQGREDKWDTHVTTMPANIFKRDDRFWLGYRGMQGLYFDQGLGFASSDNLLQWQQETDEMPAISIDEEIASMSIVQVGEAYIGISQPTTIVNRRYWNSKDLLNWTKGPPVLIKSSGKVDTISNPFLVRGKWNVLYEQDDRIYQAVLGDN
jgi:hypothetical protein